MPKKQASLSKTKTLPTELNKGKIIIYQPADSGPVLNVHLERETVWLNQQQMAELFDKNTDTIGLHIRNIFKEGELEEGPTTEEYSVVQKEGQRQVTRLLKYYNLDVIISVGYRVKSQRGTQFRIWATKILRDHIMQGYSKNQRRLTELQQSLRIVGQVLELHELNTEETRSLMQVVNEYSKALDLLDEYDNKQVRKPEGKQTKASAIDYEEALQIIEQLREKFGASDLFGQEKDTSFSGSLNAILQSFDGKDLYPSLEEKATKLLYFLVKNHSFVDGNKRIAAALFLWFLEKNKILYKPDGTQRITNSTLVALTLMIAESQPSEKDIICNLVSNLLGE